MSKKGFILAALTLNVLICLTICLFHFTEPDKNNDGNVNKSTTENVIMTETTTAETTTVMETEAPTTVVIETTAEETEAPTTVVIETTVAETEAPTTVVIETTAAQTEAPTTEKMTKEPNKGKETTATPQTEAPKETNAPVTAGNSVTINSSVNVRDAASTTSQVVGVAKAGSVYQMDASKSDEDWIAIVFDGKLCYVSKGFCTIQ